ncbi:phosphodiester glycosidase family protein [Pedobacter arcticus]|uniref:phosphodiester glycosidase family protein n=1 Tax=Pedobacter arcticus TaxID=752140 RepID=UPI00037FD950|nr:phosphodiester glycosidase family protein [Pedobacter arcticus]
MNIKKLFIPTIIGLISVLTVQAQSVVINRVFKGTEGEGSGPRGKYDVIELLVIEDHVDIRNWIIKDYSSAVVSGLTGDSGGKFRFKDVALWKDLRSGTTITLRQPGINYGDNPSPDPAYTEDTDASDFKIDLNIRNTTYLRTLAGPTTADPPGYIDRTFMLSDATELVLLRWDDGFGEGVGSANAVHAFAYGNVTASTHYTGVTSPKLHTATTPVKGAYAYAKSENGDITDFATVTGVSKDKAPPIYVAPANNSESLAQKIKNGTTLVKSISSESMRYNYPGVKEAYISYLNPADENINLYILEIDLTDPKLSIEVGNKDDALAFGTQTVKAMVPYKNNNSFEKQVVAGINGDYFTFATGEPTGPIIKDGISIKGALGTGYYYFAQLDNKTYKIGEKVEYDRLKLKLQETIGGKYLLVQNGNIITGITDGGITSRTSIGLVNDKKVIILVAEKNTYQTVQSAGYALSQLAQVMKALGATDALNLDGGGSTTLVVRESDGQYNVKNSPQDGSPRAVSNALFVMRKTD